MLGGAGPGRRPRGGRSLNRAYRLLVVLGLIVATAGALYYVWSRTADIADPAPAAARRERLPRLVSLAHHGGGGRRDGSVGEEIAVPDLPVAAPPRYSMQGCTRKRYRVGAADGRGSGVLGRVALTASRREELDDQHRRMYEPMTLPSGYNGLAEDCQLGTALAAYVACDVPTSTHCESFFRPRT